MSAENSDIVQMSNDELMEEWTRLGEQVTAGRERLKAFSKEHQARTRREQVQNLLGAVSEADKKELVEAINAIPAGIESEENLGDDL